MPKNHARTMHETNPLDTTPTLSDVTPTGTASNDSIAKPLGKRRPKIEIRYRGRIYLCSGEKGGVGKTLAARCLIETLRRAGRFVMPVEADAANLDIERLFGLDRHINLQLEGGYVHFLNYLQSIDAEHDIVVSLPAGALAGAEVRGKFFLEALSELPRELGREVITVWPIDDKVGSVEMLANFLDHCPGARVDVLQNLFFFEHFEIFDRSNTKTKIEDAFGKIMQLPRLKPEVMQLLVNNNMSFEEALARFPIGHKYEFQHWLRNVTEMFKQAGYLESRPHA